ncbi:MAG: hypothetical protein VYD87_11425, partial [Pseudomonadota bacterium]|nr:hypothetical protein [Pseudomonadota bacterium]
MRAIRFIRRGGGAGLVAVLGLAFGVFGLNPGALWRDDVPGAPEAPPPDRPAVATAPTVAAPPPPLPTLAAAPAASPVPAPSPAPAAPDPESEAAEALALSGEARVVGMRHLDDRTRLALSLPGAGPWGGVPPEAPPRRKGVVGGRGWGRTRPPPPP